MKGAECLADMLVSGRAFGIAPGAGIPEVTAVLGGDYVEERYGRAGQRLLRRDYGLVEVTFNNEPDWACVWLSVEVHRLASHEEMIVEALERYGVSFSKYTSWNEVKSAIDALTVGRYEEIEQQNGFRSFRVNEGRAVIRIVDNGQLDREDLPGHGDVWGIEIR
jgi:hypothetical protein